jgi:hypothetical protein
MRNRAKQTGIHMHIGLLSKDDLINGVMHG